MTGESPESTPSENVPILTVIGADSDAFRDYLVSGCDPCFGKSFAKTAPECLRCTAPVVVDDRLYLMRELCASVKAGSTTSTIRRLSSQQVVQCLEKGFTVYDLFRMITDGGDLDVVAKDARQLLYDRFYAMRVKGLPTPDLPPLDDLLENTK